MTTEHGNPARREPLLWLQLLGLAVLPLEVAALLLVLAGADPGPLPGLERVFCWALGALGPAVLFWKLPPDLWSLLLVQVPLRGRRSEQLQLSALQGSLPLQLLGAAGALLLLPLLWWADNTAGVAWAWSPLASSPRLVVLLMAAALLMLLLWQWQQVVQALWMFSRSPVSVGQTLPLSTEQASERRLNIGLPLLLLAPLEPGAMPIPPAPETRATEPETPPPTEASTDPAQGTQPTNDQDSNVDAPPSEAVSASTDAQDAPGSTTQEITDTAQPSKADPGPMAVTEPEAVTARDPGTEPTPVEGAEAATSTASPAAEMPETSVEPAGVEASSTVAPEEGSEQAEGSNLDQQI